MTMPTAAAGSSPTAPTPILRLDHVSFAYGENVVLGDIHADIHPGEFVCIVGPSGTGKTTLLQNLAGLRLPTSGQIVFDGQPVTGPPARMAVVFQDYSRSLMPWMSALDNVALPLKSAGLGKAE